MWFIDVILKEDGLPICSIEASTREVDDIEASVSRNLNHALYETRIRKAEVVLQHYFCPECETQWTLEEDTKIPSTCFLCETECKPKFSSIKDK